MRDVKKQIFRTADQKEFVGLFEGLCMRRHAWQAWGDFVEACAIAVSNSCDKDSPDRDKREKRYRQIMAGYEPAEQTIFPQLFGALTEALEQNPDQDFLGDMFMRLELGSHWHGQFFTPYNLCRAIAEIQMGDVKEQIQKRGWVSINDCACGAGALLKMDEEPVWVELHQAWALVEVKQNGSVMFYGNSFSCSYSRTWQVYRFQPYRRPPEGEA